MNATGARIGIYILLSVLALAAVAGGVVLSRRADADADVSQTCWAASAG